MSYHVTLQPSGHEFQVENNESVLDAALREKGNVLPYGCRNGTCGSCMATILSGEVGYPDGRPPALSEAEQNAGKVLLCQARPRSDLVIEAREVKGWPISWFGLCLAGWSSGNCWRRTSCGFIYDRRASSVCNFWPVSMWISCWPMGGGAVFRWPTPHADDLLELHVRHVPGGFFTDHVFERMKDKALLRFQGPLGTFFLREDSPRPIILMGGGTGFAPLKGMLEHAFHVGLEQPLHLYWGARAKVDLYLDALPRQWAAEHAHFRYTPVLSEPCPEDDWQDVPAGCMRRSRRIIPT